MKSEIIKYDGCTYQCYLKQIKSRTGKQYHRAFCRRQDPKCTPDKKTVEKVETIGQLIEQKYALLIRNAIALKPKYALHGREFWILDGKVTFDIPTISTIDKHNERTSVHSHSAINWEKLPDKEPFSPFSGGDIDRFRKGLKEGWYHTMIVIMADGRMDYWGLKLDADSAKVSKFLKLGKKNIEKFIDIPEGKTRSDNDYEGLRQKRRDFAKQYDLSFIENLHWK